MRRDIDNENADMIAAVEAEDAKRVARLCEEVMAALRGVDAPTWIRGRALAAALGLCMADDPDVSDEEGFYSLASIYALQASNVAMNGGQKQAVMTSGP